MSCRVLGRQMEKFMLDRLIEAAQGQGIRELIGVYRPTPKNGLVRDHFDKLGFEKIGEDLQESLYRREVPAVAVRQATHIRNENGVLSGAT
jgi:predicted enzyme involved in methoxymalonyl-ACP biosynthesis